jgi:hypothetical protein
VVLWKVARKERAEERRAEAELEGPKVRQLSKKEQDDAKKDKQVLDAFGLQMRILQLCAIGCLF